MNNKLVEELKEEWKDVEGYSGRYAVSNFGKVLSYRTGKQLCTRIYKGYEIANFHSLITGGTKSYRVHRLVALAFVPNKNGYPDVNHLDGDKLNNCAINLEWSNDSLNISHAYATGLCKPLKGDMNPNSKLSAVDVLAIREEYARDKHHGAIRDIARKYKVVPNTIFSIVHNKKWRHI